MAPEEVARFDPFVVSDFLDEPTCQRIVAELRSAKGGPATVYGQVTSGSVDERMRKATQLQPLPETVAFVRRRLLEWQPAISAHFQIDLSDCEEPQFLRYEVGGFFVAHQDGNTPLLRLERDRVRRVSTIILLNRQSPEPEPDTYCGGSLVFSGSLVDHGHEEIRQSAEVGTFVAFRAETTHEVAPVTNGERFSIVSWYHSALDYLLGKT